MLLTELVREARAKATDETQQKLTLSESAQRAREAKARKNACLNEASLVVAKRAKQEPLNMSTVGDSAIAMLVKGCAEPFAVLPMGTILAQLPKRQVSSTNHRALVTKLCRENRQTMMSHKLFSNVVHMTSKTFIQNMYRLGSACINLDHGAFRHCIQSLALRSDLAPILFLDAASYDETPMTVRTTDDALQESAETSRAFAAAVS